MSEQFTVREPTPKPREPQLYSIVTSCLLFAGWLTPCTALVGGVFALRESGSFESGMFGLIVWFSAGCLSGLLFFTLASIIRLLESINRNTRPN